MTARLLESRGYTSQVRNALDLGTLAPGGDWVAGCMGADDPPRYLAVKTYSRGVGGRGSGLGLA